MAPFLPDQIHFVHSQELLSRYPDLDAKGRERADPERSGAVFLVGIGGKLSDGHRHDVRAPDYDDWSTPSELGHAGLNGDILVWNPVLEDAFQFSSMGIRVDADTLKHQLALTGDEDRLQLEWHQALLRGEMPQAIGGGIGQSRLTMLLLQLPHIGQVRVEYGQLLFARASLLCCNNLSPPASEQAASHARYQSANMIENAHDAGFAVCRHRHGMKAMLMYPLQLFHLLVTSSGNR